MQDLSKSFVKLAVREYILLHSYMTAGNHFAIRVFTLKNSSWVKTIRASLALPFFLK